MTRTQLEHVIRAAATLSEDDEIIVIGSQAILGQFPEALAELCVSNEADVWPRNHPERADVIDGSIGELSPFHETFGYYAQGVSEETAVLPAGWQTRLIPVHTPATRGATGLCLEVHDLLISKYIAGRENRDFTRAAAAHALARPEVLVERLGRTRLDPVRRALAEARIKADYRLV